MGMDNTLKVIPESKFNAYNKAWAQITYWFICHCLLSTKKLQMKCITKLGIRTP